MQVINPGVKLRLQTPLYDTLTAASGAPPSNILTFFDVPQGGSKDKSQTNLTTSKQLISGYRFIVGSMRIAFIDCNVTDLVKFMKYYVATLWVAGKETLQAPVEFWPGGAGAVGSLDGVTAGSPIQQWTNGKPDPRAIVTLGADSIEIGEGQTFYVTLAGNGTTFGNLTGNLFVRTYLDGVMFVNA